MAEAIAPFCCAALNKLNEGGVSILCRVLWLA